MGYAVRRSGVASVVFCLLAALPAKAEDDKPDPRDAAALQECIKAKTGRSWAWENCIGTVSEPCIKDEMAMPPSEIMASALEILRNVTTGTITTMLLKKGIRHSWMAGAMPFGFSGKRVAGPAFTLRFVPVREDLATPESWSKPISTRGAIEAM